LKSNQFLFRLFALSFLGLLVASIPVYSADIEEKFVKESNITVSLQEEYTSHPSIDINSNQDFSNLALSEGWFGDGSAENPYIIEGYIFNQPTDYQILIANVNLHFIIRNSFISNAIMGGIQLNNVSNSLITNNIISNNTGDGVFVINTVNSVLSHNIINKTNEAPLFDRNGYNDQPLAIDIWNSAKITVEYNKLFNNFAGGTWFWNEVNNSIFKGNIVDNILGPLPYGAVGAVGGIGCGIDTHNNTIVNNIITNTASNGIWLFDDAGDTFIGNNTVMNTSNGLQLDGTSRAIIHNNTFKNNRNNGIYMRGSSSSNSITLNVFENNSGYGIIFDGSNHNITENIFIENNNNGKQASFIGSGINNIKFNYWNDLTSPDIDNDGFVDIPYVLDGFSNVQDSSPLIQPGKLIISTKTTSSITSTYEPSLNSTSSGTTTVNLETFIVGTLIVLIMFSINRKRIRK
jgi:parallel beta-helix repeat protein